MSETRSENGRELVLLGINHTTAPVEVRERLAIPAGRLADATRTLLHQPGVREGLILSTCNRVELLTLQEEGTAGGADLPRFLHEYFSVPMATLMPHLYEFREREAVRHLFRVASSLDSMVVGEPQILGQVKESYTVARGGGRSADEPGGAATADVYGGEEGAERDADWVEQRVDCVGGGGPGAEDLWVAAGQDGAAGGGGKDVGTGGAAPDPAGAASILVANRTEERAERLARDLRGPAVRTEVLGFEDIYAQADGGTL